MEKEIVYKNGRPQFKEVEESIEKKVNPIAIQFVEDCRAKGLTIGEVHTLVQLISWEYEKIKKEADKKALSELF